MISQSEKTNPIQTQFLQKPKMNVNLYVIEDYENETAFRLQKNKPKQTQFKLEAQRRSLRVSLPESSNRGPNKANFKRAKMNLNGFFQVATHDLKLGLQSNRVIHLQDGEIVSQ